MKKKRVLITGIAGSGGSYLAEYIHDNKSNYEIHGIARWHSTTNINNLKRIQNNIFVHEADLNDFGSIFRLIQKYKPQIIFHLAAQANVRASFDTPNSFMQNNTIGTLNLLESVRLVSNYNPTIQICSTSEVYGDVEKKFVPISETAPLSPASPYAVSKVAADLLGYTYFKNYKMKIIRTRMFSYLNPRREDLFATSFAKQVALVEAGLQKKIFHGNLNSVRTILDVNDAMEAYWIAIKKCKNGEAYNIGGSHTLSVGEFLNKLISYSKIDIKLVQDKKLLRPTDVTLQIPNLTKFYKQTKWKPKIDIEKSTINLLNYWRKEVKVISYKKKL